MISDGTYDEMNSTYRIVPREHRARSLCEGRMGGGAVVSVAGGETVGAVSRDALFTVRYWDRLVDSTVDWHQQQ